MTTHSIRELEKIKNKILALGAMVEERVRLGIRAFQKQDQVLAEYIIRSDREIDVAEVETEEECLKFIALYQPVAIDLRFIVAVIKINNQLERIADEAVNIARLISDSRPGGWGEMTRHFSDMTVEIENMLKDSLDAFVSMDAEKAIRIFIADENINTIKENAKVNISREMGNHIGSSGQLLYLLLIIRHLERIADHATNIAEEVLYLVEGEIVRRGSFLHHSPHIG
jgi:phosphate transport system protein